MKIYTKILLITLPLVLSALLVGAGVTYYLSSQALKKLAETWLQTRLSEAVKTIEENEQFLKRYEITDIISGVRKAQFDAIKDIKDIKIGEQGHIFVVNESGIIVSHKSSKVIGIDVSGEEWFEEISQKGKGRIDYSWEGEKSLAVFDRFPLWEWYVVVSNPLEEVYGVITQTRTSLLGIALFGSLMMSLLVVFLTRRMIAPLKLLVKGALNVGRGELETRIPVQSGDELGRLSLAFNDMAEKLQESHGALKRSEQHFRSLIENESGIICVLSKNRSIRYISPSLVRVLGFRGDDFLGNIFDEMLHPEDKGQFDLYFSEVLSTPGESKTGEFRLKHAGGDWRIFEVFAQNLFDDDVVSGLVLNARDITVRKTYEEALRKSEKKLHELMSQLLETQEGERKRIASELHDAVGQNLLFLKFKVAQIENGLSSETQVLKDNCEEISDYVDQILENVRRLCWDLTPSALEDLGLIAAVKGLVEDCRQHYGIDIEFVFDDLPISLSNEAQVLVYRMFQEALTNIAKHAAASAVQISGFHKPGKLCFEIKDNGKGFDLKRNTEAGDVKRGMGLSTMQERARMLNATLEIFSQVGSGTTVSFAIPINDGEH